MTRSVPSQPSSRSSSNANANPPASVAFSLRRFIAPVAGPVARRGRFDSPARRAAVITAPGNYYPGAGHGNMHRIRVVKAGAGEREESWRANAEEISFLYCAVRGKGDLVQSWKWRAGITSSRPVLPCPLSVIESIGS